MDTNFPPSENTDNRTLLMSEQIMAYLHETRRWAYFLSIMGFIGIGIIVIAAISIGAILNFFASMSPTPMPFPASLIMVVYLLIALLYFFPVLYLYRFSTKMEVALAQKDQEELTGSFENLKSMFKFIGVMTIVTLAFYVLIIVGVIIVALFMRG